MAHDVEIGNNCTAGEPELDWETWTRQVDLGRRKARALAHYAQELVPSFPAVKLVGWAGRLFRPEGGSEEPSATVFLYVIGLGDTVVSFLAHLLAGTNTIDLIAMQEGDVTQADDDPTKRFNVYLNPHPEWVDQLSRSPSKGVTLRRSNPAETSLSLTIEEITENVDGFGNTEAKIAFKLPKVRVERLSSRTRRMEA